MIKTADFCLFISLYKIISPVIRILAFPLLMKTILAMNSRKLIYLVRLAVHLRPILLLRNPRRMGHRRLQLKNLLNHQPTRSVTLFQRTQLPYEIQKAVQENLRKPIFLFDENNGVKYISLDWTMPIQFRKAFDWLSTFDFFFNFKLSNWTKSDKILNFPEFSWIFQIIYLL